MTQPDDQGGEARSVHEGESCSDEEVIVKAHCNQCGGVRNAFRRRTFTKTGGDDNVSWSQTIDTLECCGCGDLSIRNEEWFSEWEDYDPVTGEPISRPKENFWPPPSKRKKPDWSDQLQDEVLRNVLDEVYSALDHGLVVLATMGTRTLLDRAMFINVGDPHNGFVGKLDAMVAAGRMGAEEKKTFVIITDAGGAAAHRGFVPDVSTLESILTAAENFLHREFVFPIEAENVKSATPPRPKPKRSPK